MADCEIEVGVELTAKTAATAPPHDPPIAKSPDYDVFINHRGPDTKNTFASYLYRRLDQQGLRVFLDKPELQKGLNFTSQIQSAIRSASIHVAIFSPRYAESKWCLDELLQMFESGAPIIPVFYRVKPAQLRWTQGEGGVYSQDLRKLEEKKTYDTQTHEEKPRHDSTTIKKWREALSRVAEISGFELDENYTDEGELLDKVVECVVKKERETRSNEEAQISENTVLLEQQQRKQWSEQLHVIWEAIWPTLKIVIFIVLFIGIGYLIISMVVAVFMMKQFSDVKKQFDDFGTKQFDHFGRPEDKCYVRSVPKQFDHFGRPEDKCYVRSDNPMVRKHLTLLFCPPPMG